MKNKFVFVFCVPVLFGCSANETPVKIDDNSTSENAAMVEETKTEKVTVDEIKAEPVQDDSKVKNDIITQSPTVKTIKEIAKDKPDTIKDTQPIAEVEEETLDSAPAEPDFHQYTQWNTLLKKHVSGSGKVNYAGFKTDKAKLNAVCEDLKKNAPQSNWSKNQKLAYWINVYNAFTIKLVVDNYPTSSITKITAKPWDKKFITIGGSTYSLNNVENDIIRKRFNEPRIHFALNCASKSCPILLNVAYTASNLNYRLTAQTKKFFQDTQKNDFSNPKAIKISKIFDWYKVDFNKNGKTVVDFINKYRSEQLDNPSISYMEYSWDLNK